MDWSQYPGYTGKERFTTVYHLVSTASGERIALKVPVTGDEPRGAHADRSVARRQLA